MAVAMIGPKFYAWDRNGKPLAFGKLYTYQARTNTPKPTYQSEDQVVENTNPVILNGEGYANVYLDGSYKMVLKDDNDNEIWSSDPVSSAQPEEWVKCFTATYVSPNSLKVSGNVAEDYEPGRKVRIDNNLTEYAYSEVESSVFAGGETTITVIDSVVTTGVTGICASIVGDSSSFSKNDIYRYCEYLFNTVEDLKNGISIGGQEIDFSLIASVKGVVKTKVNNSDSNLGGADYEILTSAEYQGTPDGFKDFYVIGSDYVARNLSQTSYLTQMGAVPEGDDISSILSAAFSIGEPVFVDGKFNTGQVNITGSGEYKVDGFSYLKSSLKLLDTSSSMFVVDQNDTSLIIKNIELDSDRESHGATEIGYLLHSIDKESTFFKVSKCKLINVMRAGVFIRALDQSGVGGRIEFIDNVCDGINEGDATQYNPSFVLGSNKVDIVARGNSFDLGYDPVGVGACAILTAASSSPLTQSLSLIVTNNTVRRLGRNASNNLGAVEFYARTLNSVISNNKFFDCHRVPIRGKAALDSLSITGNSIRNTKNGNDIQIIRDVNEANEGSVTIDGNVIKGSTDDLPSITASGFTGDLIKSVVISNNAIFTAKAGINVEKALCVTISGNTLYNIGDHRPAIDISEVTTASINGNAVDIVAFNESIRVRDNCENVTISGNSVSRGQAHNYRVYTSNRVTVSGNVSDDSATGADYRLTDNDGLVVVGNQSGASNPYSSSGSVNVKEGLNSWSA